MQKPAALLQPRRESTAIYGLPDLLAFLLLPISVKFSDRLLQFANIFERQFPGFGQLRHHRLNTPSEKTQDFVEQSMPSHVAGHGRFEDVRVADLPHSAYGFLA